MIYAISLMALLIAVTVVFIVFARSHIYEPAKTKGPGEKKAHQGR